MILKSGLTGQFKKMCQCLFPVSDLPFAIAGFNINGQCFFCPLPIAFHVFLFPRIPQEFFRLPADFSEEFILSPSISAIG
jgi:hypothetical protein